MRHLAVLLVAIPLMAEEQAPLGVVRGDLIELSFQQITIRAAGDHVFRFSLDPKTYIERDRQRITPARLRLGDAIEILSDRTNGAVAEAPPRYARIVHVIEERPVRRSSNALLGAFRTYRSPTEHFAPRGDLTFTGIVSRMENDQIVLHTRVNGDKLIALRPDTRYLQSGWQVEASTLTPSTRVFIRAGRNFDNEIEAYQVVWGEIFSPTEAH